MERNSESSTGLEWENLALYGGKPIEIPQQLGFSMCSNGMYFNSSTGSSSSSKNASVNFSTKDAHFGYPVNSTQNIPGNTSSGDSACSTEPTIGLRIGEKRDSFPYNSNKPSSPAMGTRTNRVTMQNPCCQVEGCHVNLTSAKDYHRRHRICESHSKSPKVNVAGMERRFCQQCSRFHDLAEFDDKKRSCRRRLSVHNARRRRLQPESINFSTGGLSSALYDQRPTNLLLNGLPVSVSSSTWENAGSSMSRQTGDTPKRPTNAAEHGRTTNLHFSNNDITNPISSIQSSNLQVLDQCLNVPGTISPTAPDLQSAHSLLSPTSWSMHETESRSMESLLVHGNYDAMSRERLNVRAEQPEHYLNIHGAVGTSQMQEFQLFKASYEPDCFYSSQRNL